MEFLEVLWQILSVFVQFTVLFWPITVIVVFFWLVKGGIHLYKLNRYAKAGINDIDKLDGRAFEEYLGLLFRKLGYQVQVTPYSGDYGADLVIRQGNTKTVVQAKRKNGRVGVKAVQEAVASKEYYRCEKAMVVTNNYFSRQAESLAKANRVELWDRDVLVARILASNGTATAEFALSSEAVSSTPRAQKAAQGAAQLEVQSAPRPVSAPTVQEPTCSTCGKPVTVKVQEYCLAHAERFQGNTYCFDHQKAMRKVPAV